MTSEDFLRRRIALGLTQVELAERMKVDPRTVRRWENGERTVPGPVEVLLGFLRRED